ncbi:putative ribonuclease H-like domain-containing protein [Tanacetum coccineum]
MVPRVELMKSSLVSLNTAIQVNTAHSKTTVNAARPMTYISKLAHSTVKRPIHKEIAFQNSNINQRVNTTRAKNVNTARPKAVVNGVKGKNVNVVKASACWVWKPKTKDINHVSKYNSASNTLKSLIMLMHKEDPKAVNTACYVQNRVLVVKPHNKTPYELLNSRTPTLSFIRPFGCPITILNTIDHLGKFDCKANEGFFVGYSLNKKAFRVFNSRTRIVEENMHIMFSKSTPNTIGSRPDWLFDIDALTRTMNYEPNLAGTQSNGFADDGCTPSIDDGKKVDKYLRTEIKSEDQEKEDNVSSTNNVNTAGTNEVNDVDENTSIKLQDDPNMPTLEENIIFEYSNDEDIGAEPDMNNLDTTIQVSSILTTRIHKDHPLGQVIGDLQSTTITRRMSQSLEEHGFIKEEVYVCQPPGFEDPNFPDRVYKVEKALYGLHQAPRAWYETLSTYLLDNGFQRGKIDKTFFIKRHKGDILLVQVYVDDIIFGSTKKELCTAFENLMHEKF